MSASGGSENDGHPTASLHRRILSDIRDNIVSGSWPLGHRLPFEHELADQYKCSRMTVNKVMTELAKSGLIQRHRRSGSFVRRPQSYTALMDIRLIETEVAELGLAYGYRLLARTVRKAEDADRPRIELPADAMLVHIRCLHTAGGQPFCIEDRIISLLAVPAARQADFTHTAPSRWLLSHMPWIIAEHRIRAIAADRKLADLLDIAKGAPCLSVERGTWSDSQPVTHVRLIYPGDRHALVARIKPTRE